MRLFVIYFSILISVSTLLTETYLRYIGLGDPIRYDSNYIYGYAPKKNQKKKRLKNSTITINNLGLRTLDNWEIEEKKRIVFFGDSITYGGSYIDDNETFSHLVCEKMQDHICGNAGVNAYSIINIVMRSRYDHRLNNISKYIFLVAPGDFYREYADSKTAHFYLNKKNFILPATMEALSFLSTKYDLNNYISKKNDTYGNQNKTDLIDYSVELLFEEIQRLKNLNKDVYLIYTIEKDDKFSKKKINKYILEKIKDKKYENFFSLEEVLNDDQYFYDSVHYTKKGHEVVANEIIFLLHSQI
jgi:lysophospholipase L1-like esterase